MAFAGPINAPASLNLLTAVRLRFMQAFDDLTKIPAYSSYLDWIYQDDPTGDLIYTIYSEPMLPMRQWLDNRHMSSTDFRFWTQAVRTFGDGMELDVDDLKDDANPAKRMMYLQTAEKYAAAAAMLWPSLVAETMVKGISSIWLPDGQKIFDVHPISPSSPNGPTFRNYYANSVQGGSSACQLNYENLLAALANGLTFKAPNGLDYPIHYSELVVAPGMAKTAERLCKFDRLPVGEIFGQAIGTSNAGGDAVNAVRALYAPTVRELGNLPSGCWALIDATNPAERPVALKKRQEITWQYVGPSAGDIAGFPASDEGAVSEMVFDRNKTKYGPKARGEGFFRNWWRVAFFDGNSVPVTALSIVS